MALAFLRGRRARDRERGRRRAYIEGYAFPAALRDKIAECYPELSDRELTTVIEGLRAWFLACLYANGKTLGMPSRAVDVAWHEFILLTRDYHAFCEEAFGRYLHHSPAVAMDEPVDATLARTVSVFDRHPVASPIGLAYGLPFLFALDAQLGIEDGNRWTEGELDALRQTGAAADAGSVAAWSDGSGGADSGGVSCGGGASCGGGG